MGAKQAGASDITLIRLTDLSIKPCKGCMACVIKNEPCRISDDFEILVDHILEADGVILGAPTYIYGPPAIIRQIQDRILQVAIRLESGQFDGKVGAAIAVAGRRDWAPLTLPLMNMFLLSWGITLVDNMLADGPGPGEVLLNELYGKRAKEIGINVVTSLQQNETKRKFNPDREKGIICPACYSNLIQLYQNQIICAICGLKGTITSDTTTTSDKMNELKINFESIELNRFAKNEASTHLHDWIIASGPRYMKNRLVIETLRKKYQDMIL